MKISNFFTSKLHFDDLIDLNSFAEFCSNIFVHPTDFRDSNGELILNPTQTPSTLEMIGSPLELDINEDQWTLTISGNGGLMYSTALQAGDGSKTSSGIVGNLMDNIFNYEFAQKNPNVELYVETVDSETGEKDLSIIRMSEYHSEEAYYHRAEDTRLQIMSNKQKIIELTAKTKELEVLASVFDKRKGEFNGGNPF